jgi:hypothetical protein
MEGFVLEVGGVATVGELGGVATLRSQTLHACWNAQTSLQ